MASSPPALVPEGVPLQFMDADDEADLLCGLDEDVFGAGEVGGMDQFLAQGVLTDLEMDSMWSKVVGGENLHQQALSPAQPPHAPSCSPPSLPPDPMLAISRQPSTCTSVQSSGSCSTSGGTRPRGRGRQGGGGERGRKKKGLGATGLRRGEKAVKGEDAGSIWNGVGSAGSGETKAFSVSDGSLSASLPPSVPPSVPASVPPSTALPPSLAPFVSESFFPPFASDPALWRSSSTLSETDRSSSTCTAGTEVPPWPPGGSGGASPRRKGGRKRGREGTKPAGPKGAKKASAGRGRGGKEESSRVGAGEGPEVGGQGGGEGLGHSFPLTGGAQVFPAGEEREGGREGGGEEGRVVLGPGGGLTAGLGKVKNGANASKEGRNKRRQAGRGRGGEGQTTIPSLPPSLPSSLPQVLYPTCSPLLPPPAFFPYAPLPSALSSAQLQPLSFLRSLRHLLAHPSVPLPPPNHPHRQLLCMDVRRVRDLVTTQRQYLNQQIAALDMWEGQVLWREGSAEGEGRLRTTKAGEGGGQDGRQGGGEGGREGGRSAEEVMLGWPGEEVGFLWEEDAWDPAVLEGWLEGGGGGEGRDLVLAMVKEEGGGAEGGGGGGGGGREGLRVVKVRLKCESLPPYQEDGRTLTASLPPSFPPSLQPSRGPAPRHRAWGGPASEPPPFKLITTSGPRAFPPQASFPPPLGQMSVPVPSALYPSHPTSSSDAVSSSAPAPRPGFGSLPSMDRGSHGGRKRKPGRTLPPSLLPALPPVPSAPASLVEEALFYDRLDAYADFDFSLRNLWLYLDEAGYLSSPLDLLPPGVVTTVVAGEGGKEGGGEGMLNLVRKALEEILPLEEDPWGETPRGGILERKDSLIWDVGEEFEEVLAAVMGREERERGKEGEEGEEDEGGRGAKRKGRGRGRKEKEGGGDRGRGGGEKEEEEGGREEGRCSGLTEEEKKELEWADVGYVRKLGRHPLLRRLFAAMVHPLGHPTAPTGTTGAGPGAEEGEEVEGRVKEEATEDGGEGAREEEAASRAASRPREMGEKEGGGGKEGEKEVEGKPPAEEAPSSPGRRRSSPKRPSPPSTDPPTLLPSLDASPRTIPPSPPPPHSPPLAPGRPRPPSCPPLPSPPSPVDKPALALPEASLAPLPSPNRVFVLPSPRTPRGVSSVEHLVRSHVDERLSQELAFLGLWDLTDRDRALRHYLRMMALSGGREGGREGGNVAVLEAEVGLFLRQDERRARRLHHRNNIRIVELRAKMEKAVWADAAARRGLGMREEEVLSKYQRYLRKKERALAAVAATGSKSRGEGGRGKEAGREGGLEVEEDGHGLAKGERTEAGGAGGTSATSLSKASGPSSFPPSSSLFTFPPPVPGRGAGSQGEEGPPGEGGGNGIGAGQTRQPNRRAEKTGGTAAGTGGGQEGSTARHAGLSREREDVGTKPGREGGLGEPRDPPMDLDKEKRALDTRGAEMEGATGQDLRRSSMALPMGHRGPRDGRHSLSEPPGILKVPPPMLMPLSPMDRGKEGGDAGLAPEEAFARFGDLDSVLSPTAQGELISALGMDSSSW